MSAEGVPSDRYERGRLLGEGGAGRVTLVGDRLRGGAQVALKELAEASRGREEELRREFALLAALRHPNLVEVHDLDLDPATGLPRFTLEYVEGKDLVSAVRDEGPGILLDLAAEALRALAFLHDFGLVHRDLKPGNLLVRSKPRLGCRLVVLDFGLALRGGVEDMVGAGPAGTLPYLAPELFDGKPADRRTDLYALGAVLFEAVHGAPPFAPRGGDLAGFFDAVREGRRARPKSPPGFPAGLGSWIDGLLSPDPAERPAEASEALARLNVACGASFTYATPASRAARLASGAPPGREREIGALWEHLEGAEGPRVVWLCGGAGSGKTRILRWLASDGAAKRWDVEVPPPGMPEDTADEEGIGTLLVRLRERAARGPVLVLVDEVENASGRIAEFLERAAREGRAAPLRVVAAVRPGELRHPALRRLLADTGIVPTLGRLDLEPLDAAGVRALAERATGSGAISEARVKWLLDASEGSPLAVEALLVEGVWERGGRTRKALAMDRSAAGRLELLSEPGRAWLEALAALGDVASAGIPGRLAGIDAGASAEAAAEAAAAGLARAKDGRWSPDSRSVAEQVLAGMESERRLGLHRRGAELLLELDGDAADPWRLARLWSGATERERAADWAEKAAEKALAGGDPSSAADRYAFALRQLGRKDARRRRVRLAQGHALSLAGFHAAAVRAYGAAAVLSRSPGERAESLGLQAQALVYAGRFERGQEVAARAIPLAREAGSPALEARAELVLGMALGRMNRPEEAIPLLEAALDKFKRHGNPVDQAETLQMLAACAGNLRRPEAEGYQRASADLYVAAGRPERRFNPLIGLSITRQRQGRFEDARTILEEVRTDAARLGRLGPLQLALWRLADLELMHGRYDRVIALAKEAEDHALCLGDRAARLANVNVRAIALAAAGRTSEAAALLRNALDGPLEGVEPARVHYARMTLAEALMAGPSPDHEAIRELIGATVKATRESQEPRALIVALVVEMERRAMAGCTDPYEPVRAEFDAAIAGKSLGIEPEQPIRADIAKAAVLLRRGDAVGARVAASAALEAASESSLPELGAKAESLLAEALRQSGDSREAERALERGRALLKAAAARIEDPALRQDFLDRPDFRTLRLDGTAGVAGADRRLLALYEMIRALNSETDPEVLLTSALDMALRVVQAERGMILLRDAGDEAFSVRLSRNLEKETADDAEAFSRNVVAQAGEGKPVLALDAERDERFQGFKSISLYRIRSLMCVPLRSRAKIVGTVYVDSRREGRMFTQDDLRFLEAFADHAALALENARARADLERENLRLRELAGVRARFDNIVGRSAPMQKLFDLVEKVAASELQVLIQGESGTGKELVARAIHFHGARRRKIFLSENCAAIPETLLESELFGHVRGAFTGAERDRTGLFEQADGGTLFLDEIGDMSAAMQARLLRVLEEGEVRRVGANRSVLVDVRVLAATHRDLAAEVAAGRFREDLMYRLQVLVVQLPPLRERPGDVALLAGHFLERIARERGRKPARLDGDVLELLERYPWPGNVRQLENVLQRLSLLAGDRPITRGVLETDAGLRQAFLPETEARPLFSLEQTEREEIRKALHAAGGNRGRAARLLGISRATIYRKIKEYALE